MMTWATTPVAASDDPRWLDHERWREVVVRAQTAALARLIAAEALTPRRPDVGNESAPRRKGFEDEMPYHVRLAGAAAPAQGPDPRRPRRRQRVKD
jgi:hypothetical protein